MPPWKGYDASTLGLGQDDGEEAEALTLTLQLADVRGFLGLRAFDDGGVREDEGNAWVEEPVEGLLGAKWVNGTGDGTVAAVVASGVAPGATPVAFPGGSGFEAVPHQSGGVDVMMVEEFAGEGEERLGTEGECALHAFIVIQQRLEW
jgi:hypothetical protein